MSARTPYNVLLALCILWCLPATCLMIVGVLAVLNALIDPGARNGLSFGFAFAFEGIFFGFPGFLGAWMVKRKLRELEHPTQAPPGFDVLSPPRMPPQS